MSADTVKRLASLADFEILDTPPEQDFDDVVQLASAFCETPIALVSLVAADRQWFKARVGLDACETAIDASVCRHGLASSDLLVIPDLTLDARTADNPLVTGPPHLRFYAGAPLVTQEGVRIGMLCVIDHAPRPQGLTAGQASALASLSRQVMTLLSARRALDGRNSFIDRQTSLLDLGEALREATTARDVMVAVADALGRTLGAARAGYARIDARAQVFSVEYDCLAEGAPSLQGDHDMALFANTLERLGRGETVLVANIPAAHWLGEDRFGYASIGARSLIKVPLLERGELVAVLFVHDLAPRTWTRDEIAFAHAVADRAYWGMSKVETESRQRVLNQELMHRLKNTLAMVQAIAVQSLRGVENRAAVANFEQRLHALSAAHDVLLQASWAEADLEAVIAKVAAGVGQDGRFVLSGPPVQLRARATLSASLLFHELATNALKYGALSALGGAVRVGWSVEGDDLVLTWTERGGPPAVTPERVGFGSRLIRMGLGGGGARLTYGEEGFAAEFRTGLGHLLQD